MGFWKRRGAPWTGVQLPWTSSRAPFFPLLHIAAFLAPKTPCTCAKRWKTLSSSKDRCLETLRPALLRRLESQAVQTPVTFPVGMHRKAPQLQGGLVPAGPLPPCAGSSRLAVPLKWSRRKLWGINRAVRTAWLREKNRVKGFVSRSPARSPRTECSAMLTRGRLSGSLGFPSFLLLLKRSHTCGGKRVRSHT